MSVFFLSFLSSFPATVSNSLSPNLFLGHFMAFEGVNFGQLESFHVLANNVELFFQFLDLCFSLFCFLCRALKVGLSHGEFSGHLLGVSLRSESHLASNSDVLLEGVHALVIHEGLGLENLTLNLNGVRGSLGQFGALDLKTTFGSGDIIIKQGGSSLK